VEYSGVQGAAPGGPPPPPPRLEVLHPPGESTSPHRMRLSTEGGRSGQQPYLTHDLLPL
jgi:hypothetical protein